MSEDGGGTEARADDDRRDWSFLERLLDAPGPSGFERRPARVWRDEARAFADVWTDAVGNSYAGCRRRLRPLALLAGHVDEIGLQITHVDKEGLLRFAGIGGWDPQVLVGQRVRVLGVDGDVPGVVGRKAIHLLERRERERAARIKKLWIDVGAESRDQVKRMGLRVGDAAVIDAGMTKLAGDRIASRAIDNRVGAFVVLEALRRVAAADPAREVGAVAAATAQEEIGYQGGGARASAFALSPDVALVVDVTHATDVPDVDENEAGECALGGGPVLSRGSATHPRVFELLAETAEREGIPYSIQAAPSRTGTDADAIHLTRGGVPTGLVSIPNRYMHSPSEMASLSDLSRAADLLAAFVLRLDEGLDFERR